MDLIFKVLLFIHIPAGFIGLVLFWIPVIVKKGGNIHVKVGKAYVFSMWIVVITAMIMCIINAINEEYIGAAFLGFISILTAKPLWYAISIIKYKRDVPLRMIKINRALARVLFISGFGLLVWGVLLKFEGLAMLLVIFGFIGLSGFKEAFANLDKAKENTNWLKEHLGGMIASGIASHTAFFAFGGATYFSKIFVGQLMIIPWVAPAIVGTIAIIYTTKKYGLSKA